MLKKLFPLIVVLPFIQASTLINDLDPEQADKARLYEALASHKTIQNRLSPKSKDGFVDISLKLWLYKVTELDEAKQTMETSIIIWIDWKDEDLAWNPEDYSNISMVAVPPSSVWHPALAISNSADNDLVLIESVVDIKLYSNGSIKINTQAFTKTHCNFDLTLYPFDTQACDIILAIDGGDALVSATNVSFFESETDGQSNFTLFRLNGEWKVVKKSLKVFQMTLLGGFQFIRMEITIERAAMFYVLCVLLPLIVTSLLNLVVFWIPAGSGEKMSFLVSIYVSTALFINMLGSTLPRNVSTSENLPRMLVFLSFVIIECVMAIFATTFVMRRHQHISKMSDSDMSEEDNAETGLTSSEIHKTDVKDNLDDEVPTKTVKLFTKVTPMFGKKGGKVEPFSGKEFEPKERKLSPETLDKIFFFVFLVVCVPFYSLVFAV